MKYRFWLIDFIFLAALVAYVLAGVPLTPFHGDESTLIHTTRDYYYQFINRDLSMVMLNGNPAIDPMDQQLRLIDGRVHKYLGGLAWHLGGFTIEDINTPWLWGTDWDYNLSQGHIPTQDLLVTARYASAVLMAAGVVVIFFIGKSVGGRPAAYTAALFYAFNSALLVNGRRSMMEGSLMFFSLLTVLAGVWLVERLRRESPHPLTPSPTRVEGEQSKVSAEGTMHHAPTPNNDSSHGTLKGTTVDSPPERSRLQGEAGRGSILLRFLFLGLAAGLALSSKHTALFTVVPVFVACGLVILYTAHRSRRWIPRMGMLVAAGLITLGVFYVFNPTLWGDPGAGLRELLRLRSDTLNTQLQFFDAYDDFGQKIYGFIKYALLDTAQYYEIADWQNFIGDQITSYENSGLAGLMTGAQEARVAFVAGLMVSGVMLLINRKRPAPAGRWLIGVWSLGAMSAVLIVTPFQWQRYYLPAILPVVVLMGLGVQELVNGWRERGTNKRNFSA